MMTTMTASFNPVKYKYVKNVITHTLLQIVKTDTQLQTVVTTFFLIVKEAA